METQTCNRPVKPFQVTNTMVISIAVPMMIAYMTTPLLGVVDMAVIGQYGIAALTAGLAIGTLLIDILYNGLNFLRTGTAGLTAQALGAEDHSELRNILVRSLIIGVVSGIVILIFSPIILGIGLYFMSASEAVADATRTYFEIRIWASPIALANYAMLGWLLGIGRSSLALLVQIFINGTNIILSLVLGLWLGWGIEGVAIATIIGEVLGLFVGAFVCWNKLQNKSRLDWSSVFQSQAWKKLTNLNADIMVRSFALMLAFAFFMSQGANFGENTLAANAVLMQFFIVSGYFLDGLAVAAEQICGRAVGANYRAGFWKGLKYSSLWNGLIAIGISVLFLFLGPWIIDILTTNQEVSALANTYLIWVVFIPAVGVLAFQMDGVYIGATWSRDMSVWMLVSLATYVATAFLVQGPMGNHGLWLALYVFLIMRGVTLAARLTTNVNRTFPNAP